MKNIAILGSTGSIGQSALKIISEHPKRFRVVALSANSNAELLKSQAEVYKPKFIGIASNAERLKKPLGAKIFYGADGISEIAGLREVDIVILAISGNAAIRPLLGAISAKKDIAIANKESLVSASCVIKRYLKKYGNRLIPVDSEQSAIFQCLAGGGRRFLKKIYLTGTGGPLRKLSKAKLEKIPKKLVLNHPKWKMGRKITVDSATLMNKGLEAIEAAVLFDFNLKDIEVLIHPEAIIHSMAEFKDGGVIAQMSVPDMRIPILYALGFPERLESSVPKINFEKINKLTFEKPDINKFPCLKIAYKAGLDGGIMPAIMCAADEEAIKAFLDDKINFGKIPVIIEKVLSKAKNISVPSLSDILYADEWAREEAKRAISFQQSAVS